MDRKLNRSAIQIEQLRAEVQHLPGDGCLLPQKAFPGPDERHGRKSQKRIV
jgi:hypothetical protein